MELDIKKIKQVLSTKTPGPIDIKRHYAVAIPLIFNKKTNRWEVLYEMRSGTVSQPNEISFPGGRLEDGETYEEAAVRETIEELKIDESNITVLGEMDYLVTTGVLMIRSFLVCISGIDLEDIKPSKDEVEKIFTVPLDFLLEHEPLKKILTMSVDEDANFPYDLIPNGKKYNFSKGRNVILFYKYEDYIIWGFTALMTNSALKTLKKLELV